MSSNWTAVSPNSISLWRPCSNRTNSAAPGSTNTDLFDHSRIERMAGHFETLLRGICGDPGRTLSELPVLGAEERNKVIVEWNATESTFPDNVCIHEAFESAGGAIPKLDCRSRR